MPIKLKDGIKFSYFGWRSCFWEIEMLLRGFHCCFQNICMKMNKN